MDELAYTLCLEEIDKLEALIDASYARRDAILREIDRRRRAAGDCADKAAAFEEVVDAEFSDAAG